MGKSPGKWIKTILFGKKSSKSNLSKGREKEVLVSAKESEVDSAVVPHVTSYATQNTIDEDAGRLEIKNKDVGAHEGGISLSVNQVTETQGSTGQSTPYDQEKIRLEEAATKTQAAFRGYLARRAFKALKGIIRLQALIRGHLVRRQAVATLCSMLGIIKFQALVRGRSVRCSDVGIEVRNLHIHAKPLERPSTDPTQVNLSTRIVKLSTNVFMYKLLASSPTAKPLQLHFDSEDQNSVLSWLERWSATRFWKPAPQPKKIPELKSQRKQANGQTAEVQTARSKRTRRLPAANIDSVSVQSSESEKPKRNLRKASSHATDQVQENPQNELEKVKRSLRKVHNPVVDNSVQKEAETEKPKGSVEKISGASGPDFFERGTGNSAEKMKKESLVTSVVSGAETTPLPLPTKEIVDVSCGDEVVVDITIKPLAESNGKDQGTRDEVAFESKSLTESFHKDENSPVTNGELNHKEDLVSSENQKSSRKASIPAKNAENGLQNSPTVPSYMAATESAKAKLRAQGSPRLGQDAERNNIVRRHSLPSSNNNKITSQSPRTQRLVQSGSKGGNKNDKSLLASRDGKVTQAEWRR